jgi:hypothetical protein
MNKLNDRIAKQIDFMLCMIMNMEEFVNQGLRERDLSLRGDNEVGDEAIHTILNEAYGCAVRLR